MYPSQWVFKWAAFGGAIGSWLLAVAFVSHLNWISPKMSWVTIGVCFAITTACLALNVISKTEIGFGSNKRVFLLCFFVFLGWIIVSGLFRYVAQSV